MKQLDFFNTTNETGQRLKEYKHKAKKQDTVVLELYKQSLELTPSKVWIEYKRQTGEVLTPITSIRRSISNLTAAGKLVKQPKPADQATYEAQKSQHGRFEYSWRLADA